MKVQEKEQARALRKQGMSMKKIAKSLNIAKSTVRSWVKDIQLTEDQILELKKANPAYAWHDAGIKAKQEKYLQQRLRFQEEGRQQARKQEYLHAIGCMLYWGEGTKSRNNMGFVNSDVNMHRLFQKFLKTYFQVVDSDFCISVNCYTDNGIPVSDIENYWLEKLDLPRSCLRKTMVNHIAKSSQKKKIGKLPYGTCCVKLHKTSIVQHIFGAIQEYGSFENASWID